MNSRVYKYFGLLLIVISVLALLYLAITTFRWISAGTGTFEGLFLAFIFQFLLNIKVYIIPIILSLVSGIYYYRFGKKNKEDDGLIIAGFTMHIISVLIIIFAVAYLLLSSPPYYAAFGLAVLLFAFIFLAMIIFAIGSLLLLISWIKNKNN